MYERDWYRQRPYLLKKLREADPDNELKHEHTTLLKVELGLRLLEILNLSAQPSAIWPYLATELPPDPQVDAWNETQRRALANGRILLPFGQSDWQKALAVYANLDSKWRCYELDPDRQQARPVAFLTQDKNERLAAYEKVLTAPLPPRLHKAKGMAEPGEATFLNRHVMRRGERSFTVDISEQAASVGNRPLATFFNTESESILERAEKLDEQGVPPPPYVADWREWAGAKIKWQEYPAPLVVSRDDLAGVAAWMEEREAELGFKPTGDWLNRVKNTVRYRAVTDEAGQLGEVNAGPLEIKGLVHLPGMVGAGKSTLLKVLAVHIVRNTQWRVTLVVGDVMTALDWADYFNRILLEDRNAPPVAVPLIGRTTRHTHIKQFYQTEGHRDPGHWGHRWLNPVCPLQAQIRPGQLTAPLRVGDEPCDRLKQDEDRVLCPLFAVCPAQRLYQEIPTARIWITTPAGMGAGTPPAHLERRVMDMGYLISLESNFVFFDEVDVVQRYFDDLYARDTVLSNLRGTGLFDDFDPNAAQDWVAERLPPELTRRWIFAMRGAMNATVLILTLLNDSANLTEWVRKTGFFTAHSLCRDLAAALSFGGDSPNQPPLREAFDHLLELNLLSSIPPATGPGAWSVDLAIKAQQLAATGNLSPDIYEQWLKDNVAGLERILSRLQTAKSKKLPPLVTLEELTEGLMLTLVVAYLDKTIHIVFDEWHNATATVIGRLSEHQRLRNIPEHMRDILPPPPMRSMFGFKYKRENRTAGDADPGQHPGKSGEASFSFLQYAQMGRWYLLNYHTRPRELEGKQGPHVLAVSGTSHLPHSAAWHFTVAPKGILEPPEDSRKAIAKSHFRFLPQYYQADAKTGERRPICVSGEEDMESCVAEMCRHLAGDPSPDMSPLKRELEHWRQRNPKRARLLLLVNAYSQVAPAIMGIIDRQPDWRKFTYGLVQKPGDTLGWGRSDYFAVGQPWHRPNLPLFARVTDGSCLLVAPMEAIGRGYNILNEEMEAGFGAIYFLVRRMPVPFDMQDNARHLNRLVFDWCHDPSLWAGKSLYDKCRELERWSHEAWERLERSPRYREMRPSERKDLAAYIAGLVIQACGRLLRGGVPFNAYFVDGKWAEEQARHHQSPDHPDTPETSLLAAMIETLREYVETPIGQALYGPLVEALVEIKRDFHWLPDDGRKT